LSASPPWLLDERGSVVQDSVREEPVTHVVEVHLRSSFTMEEFNSMADVFAWVLADMQKQLEIGLKAEFQAHDREVKRHR
jgi:hypothetical protein